MNQPSPEADALRERPSRARYDKVRMTLDKKWRRRELKSERMMREVVDALWDNFEGSPYSWCGFYVLSPDASQLILGPHRDKPACSPLPLHGVCGTVLKKGSAMIVADIAASKIAVPVFDHEGRVWAVFDADSELPNAFNEMDQRWLERILKAFADIGKPE